MREKFNSEEDIVDDEGSSEAPAEATPPVASSGGTSKAWRSIERHRELRELRRHLEDFTFDDDPKNLQI
ncbi:PA3496 family putative envelope integrity protein [Plasticicumulans acidivorans]|uniref:Uncharacterized protein n=1 Tax=Plasticicumulans acidivorans TaxID=886464 RepID=A0A317MZ53_9GAMM|nr:DUF3545 domain-containing protein [Plasticicumulans acidivorans]PWV61072.1 hypothetical protein C7443_10686 [Plasticicumulans acidivorans]